MTKRAIDQDPAANNPEPETRCVYQEHGFRKLPSSAEEGWRPEGRARQGEASIEGRRVVLVKSNNSIY